MKDEINVNTLFMISLKLIMQTVYESSRSTSIKVLQCILSFPLRIITTLCACKYLHLAASYLYIQVLRVAHTTSIQCTSQSTTDRCTDRRTAAQVIQPLCCTL